MGIAINSLPASSPVIPDNSQLSPEAQKALAEMFQHVLTYSVIGIWDIATTAMNSINASTTAQQSELSMDQQFQSITVGWSNLFATQSNNDLQHLNNDSGASQQQISTDTTYINAHTQNGQTVNSFFSGITNSISNASTAGGQDSQIMNTNVTTIQGFFDFLSQLLASN